MARSEGRDAVSLSDLNAGGLLASESRRVETVKEVQNQMLDTFERFNRQQLARGNHEMEFGPRGLPCSSSLMRGFRCPCHLSR